MTLGHLKIGAIYGGLVLFITLSSYVQTIWKHPVKVSVRDHPIKLGHMQALHHYQIKKMLLIKSEPISQNPIIFHEVWITNSKWSAPPIPPGSQRRRREIKILSNSAFFSRQGAVFFNHNFMKIRVNSVLFNSSKKRWDFICHWCKSFSF